MGQSFYFYDLETSGINPRYARVMQFAGQRTDIDLNPLGAPDNYLIKLSPDVLPEPEAVLITGITPQRTLANGITEAEFLKIFYERIVKSNTIFVGFNNIRFDDEFIRYINYRNFYDAYEWAWKNGNSRWDLLDVTRITRALRPEGIKWPVNSEGIRSNQLTLLTSINKLDHSNAHNALNDVMATIDFARLLKAKQPKLFSYLLTMRKKYNIAKLVKAGQPFLYTSGKYPSEFEKTTVVQNLADNPNRQGVIVYDLRYDPEQFASMSPEELAEIWRRPIDENDLTLPVKTLQFNRCPAVAPLSVLDSKTAKRLFIKPAIIENHSQKLAAIKPWPDNILKALEILDNNQQTKLFKGPQLADQKLYDGFFSDQDKRSMSLVHASSPEQLPELIYKFHDNRLKELLPLYKARNHVSSLSAQEKKAWLEYCRNKLQLGKDSELKRYFAKLKDLKKEKSLSKAQQSLLVDLADYGKSIEAKLS